MEFETGAGRSVDRAGRSGENHPFNTESCRKLKAPGVVSVVEEDGSGVVE